MTNAMAASARVARVLTGGGRRAFASVRGDVIQVTNPATGAVVARVPADDDMSVARKFVEASRAQRKWASTPASDRAACLRRYAQLLKDKANDLASDITSEMGKPRTHAKAEVLAAARRVEAIVAFRANFFNLDASSSSAECLRRRVGAVATASAPR